MDQSDGSSNTRQACCPCTGGQDAPSRKQVSLYGDTSNNWWRHPEERPLSSTHMSTQQEKGEAAGLKGAPVAITQELCPAQGWQGTALLPQQQRGDNSPRQATSCPRATAQAAKALPIISQSQGRVWEGELRQRA